MAEEDRVSVVQNEAHTSQPPHTDLVELALLLYWRHVAFYFDPDRAEREGPSTRPEFGVGLAESLRARSSTTNSTTVASYDLPVVKEAVARDFEDNVVESLRSLEFVSGGREPKVSSSLGIADSRVLLCHTIDGQECRVELA